MASANLLHGFYEHLFFDGILPAPVKGITSAETYLVEKTVLSGLETNKKIKGQTAAWWQDVGSTFVNTDLAKTRLGRMCEYVCMLRHLYSDCTLSLGKVLGRRDHQNLSLDFGELDM